MEKLKGPEWSDQNDALAVLMAEAEQLAPEIQSNLAGLLESMLECAGSPRSALAKAALNCLLKWIGIRGINFEPFADRCATSLLSLLSARYDKHFIANLAGQFLAALFAAIPVSRAVAICVSEHRRKHDLPRLHIANLMQGLVPRLTECTLVLRPLATLIRDKNPDVRKAAKATLAACHAKFPNLPTLIEGGVSTEDDRVALRSAL
jgi:Na+/phosphate symporter